MVTPPSERSGLPNPCSLSGTQSLSFLYSSPVHWGLYLEPYWMGQMELNKQLTKLWTHSKPTRHVNCAYRHHSPFLNVFLRKKKIRWFTCWQTVIQTQSIHLVYFSLISYLKNLFWTLKLKNHKSKGWNNPHDQNLMNGWRKCGAFPHWDDSSTPYGPIGANGFQATTGFSSHQSLGNVWGGRERVINEY